MYQIEYLKNITATFTFYSSLLLNEPVFPCSWWPGDIVSHSFGGDWQGIICFSVPRYKAGGRRVDNGSIIGVESGDVTSSSVETWGWRPGTGAPLSPRRQQTFLAITHRHSQPQYVSRLDVGLVFQTCDNITIITRHIRCTQFWALACILSWTSPHFSVFWLGI